LTPSYETLGQLKSIWHDTVLPPTELKGRIFANYIDLMLHNNSQRRRSSTITQERADQYYIQAKGDGTITGDEATQIRVVNTLGSPWTVLRRRAAYMFDFFTLLVTMLNLTAKESFKVKRVPAGVGADPVVAGA
jgi:hypothetical protein